MLYTNTSSAQGRFKLISILHPKNKKHEEKIQEVVYPDNHYDAFSRIRTSNPVTLAQFKHNQCSGACTKCEEITGSASKLHNQSEASISLRVFAASASIIRQSRKYITYQPGKSLLIMMTGTLDAGKYFLPTPETGYNGNDTISRIGYYDGENGFFLNMKQMDLAQGHLKLLKEILDLVQLLTVK